MEPECFDPEDETWEEFCPKPLARFYHAAAALLPDGRVVVAGHDGFLNRPGQPSVYELEVFPPHTCTVASAPWSAAHRPPSATGEASR